MIEPNYVKPRYSPWLIAFVVTMATFMEVLDGTIVNVALPHIAGNLSAGQDESTWVLTSYLVSNAIVLPISGWLSAVFGRKRFYMASVALFTISSFLCGLASSLNLLILFRVLQGIGGGGLQPSEQSILVDTFPPEKRGMAFALAGVAMVTAPTLGPTLGGWITDNYSWRWCFYINVPIGILSMILTYHMIEDTPAAKAATAKRSLHIDYVGLGLIAIGLGFLQVVLDKGEREDWFASHFIQIAAIVTILALVGAVVWEWQQKDPIADIKLLKERNFATANAMMFILGFVLYGSTVLIPLLLQTQMGYTATQAGMVLSPGGLVVMVMMPVIGFLVSKVQPRWLITVGLTIMGAAIFSMTGFSAEMSYSTIVIARCLQVLGLSFLFIPINTIAYSYLPPGKNNNASALISLSRNLGASFGIAFVSTLLSRRAQFHQSTLSSHLTPYDAGYQAKLHSLTQSLVQAGYSLSDATSKAQALIYGTLVRQAAMLSYLDAFYLLGILILAAMPIILITKKIKLGKAVAAH